MEVATPSYILSVNVPSERSEELSSWIAEQWDAWPVEVSRPGESFVWLESYFEEEDEARLAGCAMGSAFDFPWAVRSIEQRDWAEVWKDHFKAELIGPRLWICPSWIEDAPPVPDGIRLEIYPGLSFGTGNHFTTRFCLTALQEQLAKQPVDRVLDLGAGSAILSIAAIKLGCTSAYAAENDPLAIQAARENLERNGVADAVTLEERDIIEQPVTERFPLVMANIFDQFLIEVAPQVVASCSGTLILSGIREFMGDAVADMYVRCGAREIRRDSDHEWCGLVFDCTGI